MKEEKIMRKYYLIAEQSCCRVSVRVSDAVGVGRLALIEIQTEAKK